MDVVRAETLGFCFGVRRAVRMIEAELEQGGPIFTLGAIVHNPHVVEGFTQRGCFLVRSLDAVPEGGTVAITAHGVGVEVYETVRQRNLRLIDTTCPIVRRAQQMAATFAQKGNYVVVFGEADHPEVQGILSRSQGKGMATVVSELKIPPGEGGIGLLAQTTKPAERFWDFVQQIKERHEGSGVSIDCSDTTCPETGRRYRSAVALARHADVLVVVGSRMSANTCTLVEVCRKTGLPTYHIESAEEIEVEWVREINRCGVTAGASTPDADVEEVTSRLKALRFEL
jgi:(E)-4-hydroxy-3-methyl-but-2-enyl pyrophosphate reductase